MAAPTPRDLFGSRPQRPDQAEELWRLSPGLPGYPGARSSLSTYVGATSTADIGPVIPFISRWREEIYRPERSYGSESYALAYGLSTMSLDDPDSLGWSRGGAVVPRAVRRGSPLPFRRVVDTVWVPEGHPSTWEGAACTKVNPDVFFPEGGRGNDEARATCRGCPFVTECLEWAITNREVGFWGGTTENQRKKIVADRASL